MYSWQWLMDFTWPGIVEMTFLLLLRSSLCCVRKSECVCVCGWAVSYIEAGVAVYCVLSVSLSPNHDSGHIPEQCHPLQKGDKKGNGFRHTQSHCLPSNELRSYQYEGGKKYSFEDNNHESLWSDKKMAQLCVILSSRHTHTQRFKPPLKKKIWYRYEKKTVSLFIIVST